MPKKKIVARLSPIHGNGVFADEAIRKGERIVRYKGQLRTHDEVDEAYADVEENGHTFLFTLNDDYVIDANIDGNVARWINHSCNPNCEAVIQENAKGKSHKDKVFIEAMRDIAEGEELTYNYGIVLDEPYTAELKALWGCRCGQANCTGTMLQPKPEKRAKKAGTGTKAKKAKKADTGTRAKKAKAPAQPKAPAAKKSRAKKVSSRKGATKKRPTRNAT